MVFWYHRTSIVTIELMKKNGMKLLNYTVSRKTTETITGLSFRTFQIPTKNGLECSTKIFRVASRFF